MSLLEQAMGTFLSELTLTAPIPYVGQVKIVRAQAVLSRVGFNNRFSNAEVTLLN